MKNNMNTEERSDLINKMREDSTNNFCRLNGMQECEIEEEEPNASMGKYHSFFKLRVVVCIVIFGILCVIDQGVSESSLYMNTIKEAIKEDETDIVIDFAKDIAYNFDYEKISAK